MTAPRTVTQPDPDRTELSLDAVRGLPLEDALRRGIADPGSFLPRRMSGPKGDREYEHLSSWAARACVLIVEARSERDRLVPMRGDR